MRNNVGLIRKIHDILVSKKISCVELVTSYLNEIEKSDINAFITVSKKEAIEAARKVDLKIKNSDDVGMLEGIPMSLKDNFSTKDILTTCGSKMLENYTPVYDATAWKILKNEGAILLGKNNQDEFAMGSSNETSYFGPVKNPHDKNKVPGGSSGGSSAAVASGLSVFTLGSDTGGSVRQPASFCGVVGLKATYGAISRYGVVPLASSLDHPGPLTLTVEDSSIVFDTISLHDPKDATSSQIKRKKTFEYLKEDIYGVKIGVPRNCFDGSNEHVYRAVEDAIKFYEKIGAKISYFDFPELDLSMPVYCVLGRAETASSMARFDGIRYGYRAKTYNNVDDLMTKTRTEGFGEEVKRRILFGSYVLNFGYHESLYNKAQNLRKFIKDQFNKKFEKFDILLTPTCPTTAFEFNYGKDDPVKMYLADICTVPENISGVPSISIPCGYDPNNLPIGLQLTSNDWSEDLLLRVAYKYESENFYVKIIGGVQI
ncbi:MAG: Asp-tRNA(Asn)/Glu-tRNA(Gln) amidotransferase subunit GatA [Firmicutes bacterium]|nr:Asp-tRNA(Asn)/Glu-tRNA(Gln) amidotransferase subunit GatA [Bacillota bacterium]